MPERQEIGVAGIVDEGLTTAELDALEMYQNLLEVNFFTGLEHIHIKAPLEMMV